MGYLWCPSVWWYRYRQSSNGSNCRFQQHWEVCQLHQDQRQPHLPHHRHQRVSPVYLWL